MAVKLKEHLQVLHEKCPYSELFWSEFSRIRTEYEEILCISQYSVQMRENTDQNNSEYGHFLGREIYVYFSDYLEPSLIWSDGNMFADQVKNMCFDWIHFNYFEEKYFTTLTINKHECAYSDIFRSKTPFI